MKLKSIMLGTAASLVMTTGAFAADALTDTVVPTAVDYVKVCDAFGAGFFVIPGMETCLKIGGRVRTGFEYLEDNVFLGLDANGNERWDDSYRWFANGRIDFDARTASDFGTVRSFFRIESEPDRNAVISQAFIQVGYLTAGYSDGDTVFNDDALYGNFYDDGYGAPGNGLQLNVVVDDLGGGFFVGGQVIAANNGSGLLTVDYQNDANDVALVGIVGIADQAWGSASLSGHYDNASEGFVIKATADLVITDGFGARLTAGYLDNGANVDAFIVSGAVSYDVTPDLNLFVGAIYGFNDGDDPFEINGGIGYTLAEGLTLAAEVRYADDAGDTPNTDGNFDAIVGLIRTF
ncbi:porin [Methylobrevis albus]|uniref:Porin n=1 Tax=Methylobrevis albus TaxID=2793297 RepID=A0A931I0K7_9HYPH|nr:porin [Methylobrevis albus]MBH0237046.1 porin [Methylobrevis albus]